MMDRELEERVAQLLEELGPAVPPAGLIDNVMARVSLERRKQATGRIIPFNQGGIAMTRKAMWGIAAAAAVLLAVFAVRGFPPVGYGTEGTVGAAKKYQAPQIAAKDVVLGDAVAQEFLQSEAFDRLIKDPQARSLVANPAVQAQLKDLLFLDAIKNNNVRETLSNGIVLKTFNDATARSALEAEIKALKSGVAMTSASAALRPDTRAMVADVLSHRDFVDALKLDAVWRALAAADFRDTMVNANLAAGLRKDAFLSAVQHRGFEASLRSGALAAQFANR